MDNLVLVEEETENIFYKEFNEACIELKEIIKTKNSKTLLEDFIIELEDNKSS